MSFRVNYRRELAASVLLPEEVRDVVHDILLQFEDVHTSLAANPIRRPDMLSRLYAKKAPDQTVAQYLVRPALTASDRALVVKKEKRASVLHRFFPGNVPTAEEQEVLCARPTPAAAKLLLEYPWLDARHRGHVARRAGGRTLLQEMAFGRLEDFADDEVLEVLADHAAWRPDIRRGELRHILIELFTRRPSVIASASAIDFGRWRSFVLGTMATSANLSSADAARIMSIAEGCCDKYSYARDVAGRLVENPRTPLAVVDAIECTKEQAVRMMVGRVIERRGRSPHLEGPVDRIREVRDLEWLARCYARKNMLVLSPSTALAILQHGLATTGLATQMRDSLSGMHSLSQPFACTHAEVLTAFGIPIRQGLMSVYEPRPATPRPDIDEAIMAAVARFGTDRLKWETFIGLAPEFDDFSSLLETATLV